MPALEIRTPFSRSAARQVRPDTWRKKVLPVGDVEYKGQVLHFTPAYLQTLAASFYDGAYDQVPFQLADAQNTHTNDPERYRGEIVKVDVEPDGLYVTARTTQAGSQLLATNPHLGVSARIVEGYNRSDGKTYPAAMQHVLGTLDPRIPGLGAWEAVTEMSNAPTLVLDLSEASFAGEEGGSPMPNLDDNQQARLARLLELDPDALNALIESMESEAEETEADELSDEELTAMIDGMTDEDFAGLLDEFGVGDLEAPQLETAYTGLANDYGYGYGLGDLELANYRIAETERQMSVMQRQMDDQHYQAERRKLADMGIPPYITDLARPLLEGSGHVFEMANGQGVDGGQVMRQVLIELAKQVQLLDLSGEIGSSVDEPDFTEQAETTRQAFVTRYKSMTGL